MPCPECRPWAEDAERLEKENGRCRERILQLEDYARELELRLLREIARTEAARVELVNDLESMKRRHTRRATQSAKIDGAVRT